MNPLRNYAGDAELASPSLTIENMDRHKGGNYICTADNGVGSPVSSQLSLRVLCEYIHSGTCFCIGVHIRVPALKVPKG